ncbi:MAG: SpoIIE family protein phosphatase [Clostridia bacterium]|nr:SpoIIE family protein phosphatase [Clostridia bacterium]
MKKKVFTYLGLFVLFYVMCMAYVVVPECKTFGYGFFYALMLCGGGYFVVLTYIPAFLLANLSIASIYVALGTVATAVPLVAVAKRKKIPSWVYYVAALIPQLFYVFANIRSAQVALTWVFAILLGLLFMFVCHMCLNILKNRFHNFVLNTDEKIALSIFVVILSVGLCACKFYVSPNSIVCLLLIFTFTYYFDAKYALLVSILFGLGELIVSKSVVAPAIFVLYALLSLGFKSNIKVLSIIAVVLCNIALGFYVNELSFDAFGLVDIAISGILFFVIPKKWAEHAKAMFTISYDSIASRGIVNRTRDSVCMRLNNVSQVFKEMDYTYRKMIQGNMPESQAKELVGGELVNKVCAHCPDRNKCMRVDGKFMLDVFEEMLDAGMTRGKVTLLDVPPYLTAKCNNINLLINTLNALIKNYKQYANMIKNSDGSKLLIADNLNALSSMLTNLSKEISMNITFDSALENRIKEELTYKNIIVYEVVVYMLDANTKIITLLVPSELKKLETIEKCVSKTIGKQFFVIETLDKGNMQMLTLKQKPNFDIVFGISSVGKDGVMKNGDTHSVIKLADGKFMVGLSDGMGTGAKAHASSSLAISLIENFYKADFDSGIVLSTINKLLSINSGENYSTLDLCIMDLYKNTFDFIKLGAPFCVVKNDNKLQVVEGSGLPIGVLEEMKPHITNKLINPFDTIIMFSDGVVDAFNGKENLLNYLTTITTTNPQTLAEELLDGSVDYVHGKVSDDMTVLACRIYPL